MANLDGIHFSGSLLGILYSVIVLDKYNHFVFQWQLLKFIHVLGLHRALLAGGLFVYPLPLADGELTWPGASGTNFSSPSAARDELTCSYSLWMLTSIPCMFCFWSSLSSYLLLLQKISMVRDGKEHHCRCQDYLYSEHWVKSHHQSSKWVTWSLLLFIIINIVLQP